MARPSTDTDRTDDRGGGTKEEWAALRADLSELLEAVSSRSDKRYEAPEILNSNPGWAPRPRRGGEDTGMPVRRRAALKSVNQAMERFTSPEGDVAGAIAQIRGRQGPNPAPQERISGFESSIGAMNARLEELSQNLRHRPHSGPELKDISNQISQLAEVVELLAGAVGETGQVKRLEAQIGNIARLITEQKTEASPDLADRLDRLAVTIERLSEFEAQNADAGLARMGDIAKGQETGFAALESGVRSIYDRIDTLEDNLSASPGQMERLFEEMAALSLEVGKISEAVKTGAPESGPILSRFDALNARLEQIEAENGGGTAPAVGELRADISALRDAVDGLMAPHFEGLTKKIADIGKKLDSAKPAAAPSTKQLETQIRQLMSRMDQTGEQLADLKSLYAESMASGGGTVAPDYEALADMISARTLQEIRNSVPHGSATSAELDAMEDRLRQLFAETVTQNEGTEDFAEVNAGLQQVDDRLARLEDILNGQKAVAATHEQDVPAQSSAMAERSAFGRLSTFDDAAEIVEAPESSAHAFAEDEDDEHIADAGFAAEPPRHRGVQPDTMRANPADDAPLIDRPYDAGMANGLELASALRAESGRMGEDTGSLSGMEQTDFVSGMDEASNAEMPPRRPEFDPETVERPLKPASSLFGDEDEPKFDDSPRVDPQSRAGRDMDASTSASRNTFIEAARRASQQNAGGGDESQSILARAFSRFQKSDDMPALDPQAEKPEADKESRADKKARIKAEKEAAKQEKAAAKAENSGRVSALRPENPNVPRDNFISRHRRPLLLAAAVVAVCLLTFNLVEKRMNADAPQQPAANPAPEAPVDDAPEATTGAISPSALPLDPEPTGSIDPFVRSVAMSGKVLDQPMPEAMGMTASDITTASIVSPADDQMTTDLDAVAPLAVDLPAEGVGPLALREAAANGDPRAQFEVAAILSEGKAVARDLEGAAIWYERAAVNGFAPAQYRLGNLYEHGEGFAKDLEEARLWYQRGADAGNRMAMHNLASLYASGELGSQDFEQAANWFRQAAELGLTDSQFNLGMLYARGLGVEQNLAESYKWFSIAAIRGDSGAATARDDVARSLDADQVAEMKAAISIWDTSGIDIEANFAPIGTWAQDFNPGPALTDRKVIENVQAALDRLGYDVGIPDGLMGPRTRDAIRSFERAAGMNESGAVNPRLLAVLGSQPV